MKINLFVSKNNKIKEEVERSGSTKGTSTGTLKNKKHGEFRIRDNIGRNITNETKAKNQVGNFFFPSDDEDEELYEFENNQNKKITEKKNKEIEREIKEYIYEHENVVETNPRKGLKIYHENKKKKIQYLGYRGDELTKLNDDELSEPGEKKKKKKKSIPDCDGTDERKSKFPSDERSDNSGRRGQKRDFGRDNEMGKDEGKFFDKCKNGKKNREREIELEKEIRIDDIFNKKENNQKNKSKYMDALINSAKRRELEKEILIQKKLQIDTSKEEKVFITKAYKKKMMERELIIKDLKEEHYQLKNEDKQTNYNLNLFLKNINAPSNYDRSNRRQYYEK
ncbi:hypothetical protein, conserved [Plasmodium gonderi]|uniref:Nuclear speckle splicing regulatory protein 1 N-terminal domain-containing protein n=1 Tax=Plasmodium gonderi TaxID=77519 RepID=A0A1Y1JIY7_PLAGO|nr:hypothetical protein, conserved [Plasmodium gonderi]GAW81608.1 hypothetical protein, conserved [Plasmodium gonderi]